MAAASFPSFHVTGPVHHYVRSPVDREIYYLGTAEVTPKVEHRPFYSDTFNDIGGTMVPMQRTEQGEMAIIGTLVNRYSKTAYDVLTRTGADVVARGERGRYSRGSFVFGPGSFELWLVFDNALVPEFRTPNLEYGYYYPQVDLGPHTRDRLGTDTEKLLLVFEAYPYWVPQQSLNSVQPGERAWQLYSMDPGAFPQAVLVPQ